MNKFTFCFTCSANYFHKSAIRVTAPFFLEVEINKFTLSFACNKLLLLIYHLGHDTNLCGVAIKKFTLSFACSTNYFCGEEINKFTLHFACSTNYVYKSTIQVMAPVFVG